MKIKSIFNKLLSVSITFSMLLNIRVFAQTSTFVVSDSYRLSDNIIFFDEKIVDSDGDLHKSFVIDYTPSGDLSDISFLNGKTLNTRTSVTSLVKDASSEYTPVAAINGDFFNMSTGLAESAVIVDGNLLTSDRDNYAFAFDESGIPFIDKPSIVIEIESAAHTGKVLHYNKEFTEYGLYLYSPYYGNNTLITVPTVELVLVPYTEALDYEQMAADFYGEEGVPFNLYTESTLDDGEKAVVVNEIFKEQIDTYAFENGYSLNGNMFYKNCDTSVTLGESIYAYVKEIRDNSEGSSLEIPDGCFVLAANLQTQAHKFEKIVLNDSIKLTFTCNERFIGVREAIGCGALIVDDGNVVEHKNLSHYLSANPRTAIGITDDGHVIMFGVDGRQGSYSKGLTLKQLSEEMIRLGCVYAANLDGGGSTVVKALLPYNDRFKTVNKPSDGSERKVSNAIAFYNTASAKGDLAYSYLISNNHLVLFNSEIKLGMPVFTDSSHYAVIPKSNVTDSQQMNNDSEKNSKDSSVTDDAIINELLDYSDATSTEEKTAEIPVTEYDYHGFTYYVESGKGFINENVYTPDGYAGEITVYSESPDGNTNEAFKFISLSEIDNIIVDFDKPYLYVGDVADVSASATYKGLDVIGSDKCFFWLSDKEHALSVSDDGVIEALMPDDNVTITVAFGEYTHEIQLQIRDLPFIDISDNWAKDNIIFLYEEGVSNGELTDLGRMYFPSRSFTRSEFCVMLSRMLGFTTAVDTVETTQEAEFDNSESDNIALDETGSNEQENEVPVSDHSNTAESELPHTEACDVFTDYSSIPSWALDSVNMLFKGGYLAGFEHNTQDGIMFDATNFVTRREVIRLVGNLLQEAPTDFDFNFSDIKFDDPDYQCIKNALYHGIFNGYLDGTLRLDNTLTRAEVSAVFVRLMKKI